MPRKLRITQEFGTRAGTDAARVCVTYYHDARPDETADALLERLHNEYRVLPWYRVHIHLRQDGAPRYGLVELLEANDESSALE